MRMMNMAHTTLIMPRQDRHLDLPLYHTTIHTGTIIQRRMWLIAKLLLCPPHRGPRGMLVGLAVVVEEAMKEGPRDVMDQ
jgi:hypothetical protein